MKQQISAIIEVTHKIFEAKSHATPFVGAQISNCDTFSVDLPAMRRMESQRIDAMDQSQRFKDIPKARNGISH